MSILVFFLVIKIVRQGHQDKHYVNIYREKNVRFSFAPIFRQYNWNLIELRSLVGQVVYAEKNYISCIAPTWLPVMKFEKFSSREPFLKKEWSDLSHFWGFYVQNKMAVTSLRHPCTSHPEKGKKRCSGSRIAAFFFRIAIPDRFLVLLVSGSLPGSIWADDRGGGVFL